MPNVIEPTTGLVSTNFVANTSRYLNSEIVNYRIGGVKYLTFKTYKKPTRTPSSNDQYYVIQAGDNYRPDILSKRAYGTESYWWVLLQANNMNDVYDLTAGKTIVIPNSYQ